MLELLASPTGHDFRAKAGQVDAGVRYYRPPDDPYVYRVPAILTPAQLASLPAVLAAKYPRQADRLQDPHDPMYVWTAVDAQVARCLRQHYDFHTKASAYENLVDFWFGGRPNKFPRPAVWTEPAPERPPIPEESALPAEQLQQLMRAQAAGPPEVFEAAKKARRQVKAVQSLMTDRQFDYLINHLFAATTLAEVATLAALIPPATL